MQITIGIFEQRSGGHHEWTTLGLGPRTRGVDGQNRRKLEQRLVEDLRRVIAETPAVEAARFPMPRGLRIARVRLDLSFGAGGDRRRVSGVFPVIIEPCWASAHERVEFAYHPMRQEEGILVVPDVPLEEQLKVYWQRAWARLEEDELDELLSRGRERLMAISFACTPRSVLDDLPQPKGARDALLRDPMSAKKPRQGPTLLPKIGADLTLRAAQGELPLGVTRVPYRERLHYLLGGQKTRSVIVVGPPGSGKTTLVHQVIADLLEADGYGGHKNLDRVRHAWQIAGKRVIAGMSHLGDWEKRCVELLADASGQRIVLYVEDIAHFGRLGRSRDSDRSFADFFRGPLARGQMTILGEATPEQLRALEEDAPSFAGLFAVLPLPEATPSETTRLLVRERRELERAHEVEIDPFVLGTVVELSGPSFAGQAFPGKAIELLRELARSKHGAPALEGRKPVVEPADALGLLSRKTGMPEILLRRDVPLDPEALRDELSRQVLGQDEAVRAAVDVITRIKAGLTDPRRPYGVLLFTGPTGTGKTELAKCIAEYLYGSSARLSRFDMSEYATPDAPARLIGHRWSPDGVLTRRVMEQPFSLVLFDEIEKADRSVHSLLLQLFEDGRLTDAAGRTAFFTHTVVIMTSNLGARVRPPVGFEGAGAEEALAAPRGSEGAKVKAAPGGRDEGLLLDVARAVRDFFPPELFNRIDRIVPFRPLTPEVASSVAAKELDKLLRRRGLTERSIFVQVAAGVPEAIAREAFAAADGARSVKRYLEDRIGSVIGEAIAGGPRAAMQIFRLGAGARGFELAREALEEARPVHARWAIEPLLALAAGRLEEALPDLVRAIEPRGLDAELGRLSTRIGDHLAQHSAGSSTEHAEAIYQLDELRSAILTFREHRSELGGGRRRDDAHDELESKLFTHSPTNPPPERGGAQPSKVRLFHRSQMPGGARKRSKQELLELLASGYALRRALQRFDEPGQHAVIVELLRAGQLGDKERFEKPRPGLLEALARAYGTAHGAIESWAAEADGGRRSGSGREALDDFLKGGAKLVVLRIVGLCVRDFFELEMGTHLCTSLARGPEIVRVRVSSARTGDTPAEVMRAFAAKRRAWDERHRAGTPAPTPEDPSALLPLVRKIRFDPPDRPGASASFELEDYVMGHADAGEAKSLGDVLAPLWLLRTSREDIDDRAPEEAEETR